MPYLFTSESVSEGHPDKVADQISDAIIDAFLAQDPNSKVACETLVTTGLTVVSGEVRSKAYIDVQEVARRVIRKIGYTKSAYKFDADSCGVLSAIHEQSADIAQGVDVGKSEEEQGAGDQGMMFGYANNETDNYMPMPLELSHRLLRELAAIRREGKEMTYLRPDSKSQVTIEYNDDHSPKRVNTIVVSTQHDDFDEEAAMLSDIGSKMGFSDAKVSELSMIAKAHALEGHLDEDMPRAELFQLGDKVGLSNDDAERVKVAWMKRQ